MFHRAFHEAKNRRQERGFHSPVCAEGAAKNAAS